MALRSGSQPLLDSSTQTSLIPVQHQSSAIMPPPSIRRKPVAAAAAASSVSVDVPPQTSGPANGPPDRDDESAALHTTPEPWPALYHPDLNTNSNLQPVTAEKKRQPQGGRAGNWFPFIKQRTASDRIEENLAKQFTGRKGFKRATIVQRPMRQSQVDDPERGIKLTDVSSTSHEVVDEEEEEEQDSNGNVVKRDGKFVYLNQFHQPSRKFRDVAVYLSPTNYLPRRMVVQASDYVLANRIDRGDWIRTKVRGHVPVVLKMAEWALGPLERGRCWNKIDGAVRSTLVALPIQFLLAIPGMAAWDLSDVRDSYTDFPGYHWEWPKYAINYLDMAPVGKGNNNTKKATAGSGNSGAGSALDVRVRSPRPRKVVKKVGPGKWEIVDGIKESGLKYIFVSYAWTQFADKGGDATVTRMAEKITEHEGLQAYWLDKLCIEKERGFQQDYDVYTMCDIVRSAHKVAVVLGDAEPGSMTSWGRRMWTLPEGLLAPCDEVLFVHEDRDGGLVMKELHKVEMTATCWAEPEPAVFEADSSSSDLALSTRNEATRILAEHFSGLLPLSRLELLPAVITALNTKARTEFTGSDLAYAVMGLLHYRIERDDRDTLFQNLAKLSLSNDGDDIVERMICLLPKPDPTALLSSPDNPPKAFLESRPIFEILCEPDEFETMIHHIKPLCEIVGVAEEDETVMIDNCRAIHIRWKDFPQAIVQRSVGLKRMIAAFLVGAGLWWLTFGLQLVIYYIPFWADFAATADKDSKAAIAWLVSGFLFVGFLLSVFGPISVRRLFGGIVLKSSPSLVAFEGVMPIAELEKIVFGNCTGRLSYAPSATPWARDNRHPRERRGVEPHWIDDPEGIAHLLPSPRHHLFTLVDMGELSVSIFSAERPPTVALLCGREGGMLRAVLCSWRFDNDCLYKETVVRMPSRVYGAAFVKDWLKLSLKTQDQARRGEMRRRGKK